MAAASLPPASLGFMIKIANWIDRITRCGGRLAAGLLLILIAMIFYNVAGRYVFSESPVWLQEMEWHLLAPIAMLGLSVLMMENGHVRVDMLYERLSPINQHRLDLFSMLVGTAVALLLVKYSYGLVESAWSIGEGSADPGGLPMRYALKAILPAGFLLLALQCLANALRHLAALRSGEL